MGGNSLRILIIDDNRDAADMLVSIFELHGHVALATYDGMQGIAAAMQFAPEVIFLDLGMPQMDGYQVAAKLRRMPLPKRPLLIAFTAWNDAASIARVAEAGFDLHLTKTSPLEALLGAIQAAPVKRAAAGL
jgi:two-component system CheB/CheR fusion protein